MSYNLMMETAQSALYHGVGKIHEEEKKKFLKQVTEWCARPRDQREKLTLPQASGLYEMIIRLKADTGDEASTFFRLMQNELEDWGSAKRLIKPRNYRNLVQAIKLNNQKNSFNEALWDYMHCEVDALSPEQAGDIFATACAYSSPGMIEAFYTRFIAPLDPKPNLLKARSALSMKFIDKLIAERHMNGDPLTSDWENKLIEMGALKPDSIEKMIEALILNNDPSITDDNILTLIQYWKSTRPKEALAAPLKENLIQAMKAGRVELAKILLADPATGKFSAPEVPALLQGALQDNPKLAKIYLDVFGKQAIYDEVLYEAYSRVKPYDPELIQALKNNGEKLSPGRLNALLTRFCQENAVAPLKSLLYHYRPWFKVEPIVINSDVTKDMLNRAFTATLADDGKLNQRLGVLLALKTRGAVPALSGPPTPTQKRVLQACDYAVAFADIDKTTFLDNLEYYANQKLGRGLNARAKNEAIQSMIQVLRHDPSATMPELFFQPFTMNQVPYAAQIVSKGGLLSQNQVCLLDAMNYNRNPLSALFRVKRYKETTTMQVMKQTSSKALHWEVVRSLGRIKHSLFKKLGDINALDEKDPGRVKYERLVSIFNQINTDSGHSKPLKSLNELLTREFEYGEERFTLLETLNIQRSTSHPRKESSSLKTFLKDLHVKEVWKAPTSEPESPATKPGRPSK